MNVSTYAVIVFIVALLIIIIGFFVTMHKFDFSYLLIAGAISMIIIVTIGIAEAGLNLSLISSKKMSYISVQEITRKLHSTLVDCEKNCTII